MITHGFDKMEVGKVPPKHKIKGLNELHSDPVLNKFGDHLEAQSYWCGWVNKHTDNTQYFNKSRYPNYEFMILVHDVDKDVCLVHRRHGKIVYDLLEKDKTYRFMHCTRKKLRNVW